MTIHPSAEPAAVDSSPARRQGPPWARRLVDGTRRFRPVLLLVIVMFICFSVAQPRFYSWANQETMLIGIATLWVISIGGTFVVVSGGVDLSVGGLSVISAIALGKLLGAGVPAGLAVLLAVVFGAALGGGLNGGLIGYRGLSFFVVTLGVGTALAGIVNVWSHTATYFVTSPFVLDLGRSTIAGLAVPIWIMLVTLAIGLWAERLSYWGRDVFAVGDSLTAARLSGIRTGRTLMSVYAVSGAAAALAGVLLAGELGAASPQVDPAIALEAAAAILLGGTTLGGGVGGVLGTAIGVLFIGMLQNGLSISGVPSYWQQVVTGVILVLAVWGNPGSRRMLHGILRRRRVS